MSDTETLAADGTLTIEPVLTNGRSQLTLRLSHLADDGSDLALDNIVFRQLTAVPEPGSAIVCISMTVLLAIRRRRNH